MVSPRRMSILQRKSALAYREGKDIHGIHEKGIFLVVRNAF